MKDNEPLDISEKFFNSIPGLLDAGWSYKDYQKIMYIYIVYQRTNDNSNVNFFTQCKNLITKVKNHKSSWPFLKPVDVKEVPDYYEVIKEPMGTIVLINRYSYTRK